MTHMNISYEEAMRRIDEFEKEDHVAFKKCCRETSFPYDMDLYRGENQILVEPIIKSMFWRRRGLGLYRILPESETALNIGKTVLEVFDYLLKSPVDTRTMEECKEDSYMLTSTSCKNFKTFAKRYSLCGVILYEDGSYIVSPTERLKNYNGYGGASEEECFKLPKEATAEEIGNAVIAAFERSDEYERAKKPDPYPPKEIELLCGKKLTVYPPRDRHFTDMEDGSAAEIYQLYEYAPSEDAEATAAFYLGIAAELDCDISEGNIRNVWEKQFGDFETFEIKESQNDLFSLRVEMKNKNVHRISYLTKIDESELLECTMELKSPKRRKKLDERLTAMFEEFAAKCKFIK
ncbi:MAG: hypothetical protein J1E40_02360 [Oscillospiraceae bacterium]|nr:hypothetical protein [Oscillospiraceae bacterium]